MSRFSHSKRCIPCRKKLQDLPSLRPILEGEAPSKCETIQLSDSTPQRSDAVARQLSLLASPLKERFRCWRNQLAPVIPRLLIVGFFVHRMLIQTKNPCLD